MRAREFVRETAVGHILTPRFEIVVDDHALERARERGVDPQAVDYIIRTQLPKVSRKLDQIEVNQKFWVYDWSRELALGLRRLSSTEPRFLLKTVWPGRPARTPEAEQIVSINESVGADQVLQYVKRVHAPDEFNIEYSITDHPEWELTNIPLRQLNLDPDGETQDPYNRVNWVDDDKVQELIPRIGSVLKSNPIVVDPTGWIIDGNHRAMAAAEAGLTSVPALVPVKQGVAESREDFEGITIEMKKRGHVLDVSALDDWGNNILGYVIFNIGDNNELDPQELEVDHRYQGQGIAKAIYDYTKSKGYTINRSWDQTDAGKGFWDKHRGEDVRVWENFADGRVKGKSRPGRVKRAGASCDGSVTDLRRRAKNASGEKAKMYHWCANMKSGRKK